MARMTPQPSAINLTFGLALTIVAGVLAVFGGVMIWVGLALGLIGACQLIIGVYRLATAIDVMAAQRVRKPAPVPADK